MWLCTSPTDSAVLTKNIVKACMAGFVNIFIPFPLSLAGLFSNDSRRPVVIHDHQRARRIRPPPETRPSARAATAVRPTYCARIRPHCPSTPASSIASHRAVVARRSVLLRDRFAFRPQGCATRKARASLKRQDVAHPLARAVLQREVSLSEPRIPAESSGEDSRAPQARAESPTPRRAPTSKQQATPRSGALATRPPRLRSRPGLSASSAADG